MEPEHDEPIDRAEMACDLGMKLIGMILSDKNKDPLARKEARERACAQLSAILSSMVDMVHAAEGYARVVAISSEVYADEDEQHESPADQTKSSAKLV